MEDRPLALVVREAGARAKEVVRRFARRSGWQALKYFSQPALH